MLHQHDDHLAQPDILHGIAQIAEPLQQGHPGTDQLFQMETKGDQLAASYFLDGTGLPGHFSGSNQVQPHAIETKLQVRGVDCLHLPGADPAQGVHGLVTQ